jgi:hypothetical protein
MEGMNMRKSAHEDERESHRFPRRDFQRERYVQYMALAKVRECDLATLQEVYERVEAKVI